MAHGAYGFLARAALPQGHFLLGSRVQTRSPNLLDQVLDFGGIGARSLVLFGNLDCSPLPQACVADDFESYVGECTDLQSHQPRANPNPRRQWPPSTVP